MAEFASNAKGNAALATGIIGATGVGLGLLNGSLGNIFGCRSTVGQSTVDAATAAAVSAAIHGMASNCGRNCGCNEDHLVDRYEAGQSARIAELETEVKFRDSTIYTDQKSIELFRYIDGKLEGINAQLASQAVMNQKTADSFDMVRSDMICCKNELYKAIAAEAEKRCCGDNSIVTYANATFYPKMVADVTTGTTTTAQPTYNPIPRCGDCCRGN